MADPAESTAMAFRLKGSFETRLEGADDSSWVAPELLDPTELTIEGKVVTEPVRTFRDGSIGHQVCFPLAQAWSSDQDTSQRAGIEGHCVEIRTFDDGEILRVDHGEHISGWGRYGEVFDLFVPLLGPNTPSLEEGEVRRSSIRWPFEVEGEETWWESVDATWTHKGVTTRRGEEVLHLHYEGPWTTTVIGSGGRRVVVAEGIGQGELWLNPGSLGLVEHEVHWQRDVRRALVSPEPAVLVQTQRFEARLTGKTP